MTSPLPPAPFPRALMLRAAGIWLGTRLLVMVFLLIFGGSPVDPSMTVLIPALSTFLATGEARRRNEVVLLGNLGVAPAAIAALSAAPAVAAEAVIFALVWVFP